VWGILIVRDAHSGLTRFDQFRKSLGIAPTMLTRRLAALAEQGLLEKGRYSERPGGDEYVLTAAGRDILPVLFMTGASGYNTAGMASWFASWMRKQERRSRPLRSMKSRRRESGRVQDESAIQTKIEETILRLP
jgi:DNA-binding HxlR family transcriptional regulator